MDSTSRDRFPRLAPVLLAGTLVAIAATRPGILASETDGTYRHLTTLVSCLGVAYVAWRFHGIIPAAVAILLLFVADRGEPDQSAYVERGMDTVLLLTLALGIGVCSRARHAGTLHWIVLLLMAAGIACFGWYGWQLPLATDAVARERTWHVVIGSSVLALIFAIASRRATWFDRARTLGVLVIVPFLGLVAGKLTTGAWPRTFEGGDWVAVFSEWKQALTSGDWFNGAWAWTLPWIVAPLMLIGLWRTAVRGRKEWKRGRPPLAWLLTATSIASFVAIGARPLASGSLALAAVSALLCVFGIADLIQALVERIALEPPQPGISDVPRVK